jgi:hypothetical protein
MRRLYVWGMILWSIGWLFLPPYVEPSPRTFWWLAGIGTLVILLAGWQRPQSERWSWLALLPAAALALFGWQWFGAIYIGPLILAVGAILMVLIGSNRWGGRLADGLVTAGTVAVLQLIGLYLYEIYLGPRGHGAAIPSEILASFFQLAGVKASALSDGLHIMSLDRLYQVAPTPSNMGLFVFLQMFMGLIALTICGKTRVRAIFIGAFVITVFAFFRYAAVVLWDYTNEGMFGTYWRNTIFAWTVWPVGLFLHGLCKPPPAKAPPTVPRPSAPKRSTLARHAVLIVAGALGVFFWTAYEGYHAHGTEKQGRILIDEMHSDWEWSDMPMDTVWYGQQSTYNFYSMVEYWKMFYHADRGYDTLTPELLANYDILVLKVPTLPYSQAEVDAVYDWVCDGGGLMLIGEHTNVFGYATFLNPVTTKFGQRFIADIAYDLRTGDLNLYDPPTLLPHPITQNMPTMLWGGPCTSWGDLSARSVCTAVRLKTLPADYTQRNFFPERTGHTGYRFGIFYLANTTRCGKGRIVTFNDSTIWSNFFIFVPGKIELCMGMVEYLNRYESFPYWRMLAFLFAVAGLFVAAVAARGLRLEGWLWLAAVGFLTFAGSAKLIEAVNMKNYPLPKRHTDFPQLNFESEHSRFFIPELRLARQGDKDFSTFYLWAQRVDVVPRKWPTLEESLAHPGAQIIIDPELDFTQAELDALKQFVTDGGTLYIFDGPHTRHPSSNVLMGQFGLQFDMSPIPDVPGYRGMVADVLWRGGGRVIGGEPIVMAPDSSVSCARLPYGKGQVIAFANSNVFERKTMGYTAMIPNAIQNTISQFEYQLLEYVKEPFEHQGAEPAEAAPNDSANTEVE